VRRGEIVWVQLTPRGGREQAGRRPGVVLQGSKASSVLPTLVVVPLTTQIEALRFPGTVLVEPDAANGLRHPSVALVFQVTAVDQRVLAGRLGRLDDHDLARVHQALDELLERS
jgi:mRNA interferase MazF